MSFDPEVAARIPSPRIDAGRYELCLPNGIAGFRPSKGRSYIVTYAGSGATESLSIKSLAERGWVRPARSS